MSEPNFSRGPWRVAWPVPTKELCKRIITADGDAIMGDETYYPWTPEKGHDWMLIACAPEMYDLLIKAKETMLNTYDVCDYPATGDTDCDKVAAEIDKLLAKARGDK